MKVMSDYFIPTRMVICKLSRPIKLSDDAAAFWVPEYR